eukprot:COSAG02_NODE_814_length_16879_cov_4.389928_12_plen_522_part_00
MAPTLSFAVTSDGADTLLEAQLAFINADPALIDSSRALRTRETKNIVSAALQHLEPDTSQPVHVWFGPDVVRSMNRTSGMDTLSTVAGKAIEYCYPPPARGQEENRPEDVLRTLAELSLLKARRTKSRRGQKAQNPPPSLASFRDPGLKLAERLLSSEEDLAPVDVVCCLMLLLVTVRVNGLRDIKWGDNLSQVAGQLPAYRIRLGASRGGTKNAKRFNATTTDAALAALETAEILSPTLAVEILGKYESQCTGSNGDPVFAPRLGENTIGTRFKTLTGSTPGEWRRRVAWEAQSLVSEGKLDDSVTAYLVSNMQHDPSTHVHDYEGSGEEQTPSPSRAASTASTAPAAAPAPAASEIDPPRAHASGVRSVESARAPGDQEDRTGGSISQTAETDDSATSTGMDLQLSSDTLIGSVSSGDQPGGSAEPPAAPRARTTAGAGRRVGVPAAPAADRADAAPSSDDWRLEKIMRIVADADEPSPVLLVRLRAARALAPGSTRRHRELCQAADEVIRELKRPRRE